MPSCLAEYHAFLPMAVPPSKNPMQHTPTPTGPNAHSSLWSGLSDVWTMPENTLRRRQNSPTFFSQTQQQGVGPRSTSLQKSQKDNKIWFLGKKEVLTPHPPPAPRRTVDCLHISNREEASLLPAPRGMLSEQGTSHAGLVSAGAHSRLC